MCEISVRTCILTDYSYILLRILSIQPNVFFHYPILGFLIYENRGLCIYVLSEN
jgi:hypothetical protein